MKCRYCGYEIPDGILYCEKCGREVQMVPDYNPFDDMLAAHVKDAINNTGRVERQNSERMAGQNFGRVSGRTAARRTTGQTGRHSNTSRARDERELRRRQAEKKRALKKKKRRKLLMILFLLLIIAAGASVALYMNSYAGIVRKGNSSLQAGEYKTAERTFQEAIAKSPGKPEAYTGLSKAYLGQEDPDAAENVFLEAVQQQPENTDLYEAAFQFYKDTDQPMGIPALLDEAGESVVKKLSGYVVEEPEFSLDEEVYDDVQQLTLTSAAGSIYYTTDGSAPDPDSTEFQKPIQLDEGTTLVQAISVNKDGIPSRIARKEYVVKLPIEDAPAVSPSTGQYEEARTIEIKVPDGCTAYYTTDGTDPTEASERYDGPVDMPQGETLFKAILVTKSGRVSGVTTRNYIRE